MDVPSAAASGATPAADTGLHDVLAFLFSAKLAPTDAFAAAKAFMEGGVNSTSAIARLTPERVKALAGAKISRKIINAIKRMPSEQPQPQPPALTPDDAPSAKRTRPSPYAPDPPPPPCDAPPASVRINRSPVMILWAAKVAEALGYDWSEALSLASAAAGVMAHTKGSSLGIISSALPALPAEAARDAAAPSLLGIAVPAVRTAHGWRGLSPLAKGGGYEQVHPLYVFRSLEKAFEGAFAHVHDAMGALAREVPSAELRASMNRLAFSLYADFRPHVSAGKQGWGERGTLELAAISRLRARYAPAAAALRETHAAPASASLPSGGLPQQ